MVPVLINILIVTTLLVFLIVGLYWHQKDRRKENVLEALKGGLIVFLVLFALATILQDPGCAQIAQDFLDAQREWAYNR